jgi:hypothetical protein
MGNKYIKSGKRKRYKSALRGKTSPIKFYNFETIEDKDEKDSYYDEEDPDLAIFKR